MRPRSSESISLDLSSLKCALALMCRKVIEAERKVGDQEWRAGIEHVSRQRGGEQERRGREASRYRGREASRYRDEHVSRQRDEEAWRQRGMKQRGINEGERHQMKERGMR